MYNMYLKYLKYKNKYLNLKNMIGGSSSSLKEVEPSAASQFIISDKLDINELRKLSAIKILYNLHMGCN